MKVFNGDFFFQRFLLAIRVELADLISPAIRTTLKACGQTLLALWIQTQWHGSNANALNLQCPYETLILSKSSAKFLYSFLLPAGDLPISRPAFFNSLFNSLRNWW
jgi:hypothetical protein